MPTKRYRVVKGYGPFSLRQSPDRADPLYERWFEWRDGDVFSPPAHLKSIGGLTLAECVERGMLAEVQGS